MADGIYPTRRCHICLGTIKLNVPMVQCECGKTFHESCARRVNECPNCGRPVNEMRPAVRQVVRNVTKPADRGVYDPPAKNSRWKKIGEMVEDELDKQ